MPGAEAGPVAVVAAIPEEFAALRARVRDARAETSGVVIGRLGGVDVVIAAAGDGTVRAARGVARLCEAHRPRALVGMGVAGALTHDLSPYDVLVGRRILGPNAEAPTPDAAMVKRALAIPGAREATFVTARGPIVTRSARAGLAAAAGDGASLAVDMESAAWAREAAARGVPYAILRVVSDGPDEELPVYLTRCMDAEGGISRTRVALAALTRPASIPALWSMRGRVREACSRLAAFVEHYVGQGL
jgi:adenosylhomocysteine nucleosidase